MEPLALTLGLAALLGLSSAVLEVKVAHTLVSVIQGKQAILPVWYTSTSVSVPFVTWHRERPGERFQILAFMYQTTKVEDPDLKQRLGFLFPMPFHNVSIVINNTKEIDSGQYMCTVNIPDDSSVNGRNIGLVNLTVLVPPSPPKCQIRGSALVGGNVTMSCKSAFGKPVPDYHWQRTEPSSQFFFAPAQDTEKGMLMLTNLTIEMSGVYFCNASSSAGHSNCTLTLEVHPPFNTAVVAGAVVGTLLGLGLIIFFTLQMFVYQKKKKEAQEEVANEIKEDAVAPKTLSWVKNSGTDGVFKNGTLSSMNTTQDQKPYQVHPASDTASITTAAGSMVGFKPPFTDPRNGTLTPTPSLSSQSLPLYFPPVVNGVQCHHANVPIHRNTLHRTNRAQPQAPQQQESPIPTSQGLTASTLNRMGAVPVMVPAQSQAGSLV
ncbi:endothelial cell-selective adhesion molecule [Candoia aspera]|uniref:endothelial cell-selective adhesion molecule n=1 Tax=Candoia aspera TaxID=51853 RepID=UPI002FD86355